MFALFNRMSGAGDAIADEALITQSCAGRTDGIRLSLEFLGYVPKGPTKAQVLRVLGDITGNPGDIRGTDAIRVALPLFAAASALMLRQGDRSLADSFRVDFDKGMAELKAARAAARALVKAAGKGKDKASTPNRIDDAIALLDAAVNANTLTDAQCAALRNMVERMAIPA